MKSDSSRPCSIPVSGWGSLYSNYESFLTYASPWGQDATYSLPQSLLQAHHGSSSARSLVLVVFQPTTFNTLPRVCENISNYSQWTIEGFGTFHCLAKLRLVIPPQVESMPYNLPNVLHIFRIQVWSDLAKLKFLEFWRDENWIPYTVPLHNAFMSFFYIFCTLFTV